MEQQRRWQISHLKQCELEESRATSLRNWKGNYLPRVLCVLWTFKINEFIRSIHSHHNGTKLEINSRNKTVRSPNTWRVKNTFLNNWWDRKNVSKIIKKNTCNWIKMKMKVHGLQLEWYLEEKLLHLILILEFKRNSQWSKLLLQETWKNNRITENM